LIATWYLKAHRNGEISEQIVRTLTDALSSQPPVFHLPHAATAHTRHYMPYNQGRNEKTTKVFDTFIQIAEGDSVLAAWDIDLPTSQLAALKTLAHRLGYLGRAESLVEARVLEGVTAIEPNAVPLAEGARLPNRAEIVRLLAPMKPSDYDKWAAEFLASNPPPGDSTKKSGKKARVPERPEVPENLFAALHADTGELQAAGWNLPPGAQYVNYIRPESAFAPAARPPARRTRALPTVARYAVVSAVLPGITWTVSVAERVHAALCAGSDKTGERAAVFTGLGNNGKPRDGHTHAHIFCEANDGRDSITHITIWAPMRFSDAACLVLRSLNKVWGYGGHDIRLVLHGVGQPGDFTDCSFLGTSRIWRSFTPFVSTRHAKAYRDGRPKMDENGWQQGSAAHDLLRLLNLNPKWQGVKIRRQVPERELPFAFGDRRFRSLQFQTIRRNGNGRKGDNNGAAFIIEFPEPVSGPIAVGYGSHFGLGLFVPS